MRAGCHRRAATKPIKPPERIAVLAGHWAKVGGKLDKAVEAYSKSVATLESRVLVSARRLRELKAAVEGAEIEAIEPIERTSRALQAGSLFQYPRMRLDSELHRLLQDRDMQ